MPRLLLPSACALLALAAPLAAQEAESAAEGPDAFTWRFGLVERFDFRDPLDPAAGGDSDTLSRTRVLAGTTLRWGTRADLVVDAIGTAVDFDDVEGDLLRAYVDLHAFWSQEYDLRVGRFGLRWGDGRFLGDNLWELQPDAWDGIHLRGGRYVKWELLYADGGLGPAALHEDELLGGRATFDFGTLGKLDSAFVQLRQEALRRIELDVFLHWRNETRHGQAWELFAVLQDGEDSPGARDLWAQAFVARFEQALEFDNTVFVEFGIATGDDNPTDRDSNTYTPSLIDFHRYTGRADVLAFSNLIEFVVGWRKAWTDSTEMHLATHFFRRQNTDDVIYLGVDATPLATPGTSADVGQEVDLAFETDWSDALHTEFGVAYLMVGDAFVQDDDILVAYLWLVWEP